MSRERTPAARHHRTDFLLVLCPVFVGICAAVVGRSNWFAAHPLLRFAFRSSFFLWYVYCIMFAFYRRGARDIAETFLVSFCVMAMVFFIAVCPFRYFASAVFVCMFLMMAVGSCC
jgi:hypothetical protein